MNTEEDEARKRIQREAARRLAKLGGSMPELQDVPRRRPPNFTNDEPDEQISGLSEG